MHKKTNVADRGSEEYRFIIESIQLDEKNGSKTAVESLLDQSLDLNYLIYLSRWHNVGPLIYSNLQKYLPEITSNMQLLSALKRQYDYSLAMNLGRVNEIEKVAHAFNRAGIDFCLFQGIALLATIYYPLIGLRPMRDTDLLLPKSCLTDAGSALQNIGYNLFDTDKEIFHRTYGNSLAFIKEDMLLGSYPVIELHFLENLAKDPIGMGFQLPVNYYDSTFSETAINKQWYRVLGADDFILRHCMHAVLSHQFGLLIWIVDLKKFLEQYGAHVDWNNLVDRIVDAGVQKPVYYYLELAQKLFHLNIPENFLRAIQPESSILSKSWIFPCIQSENYMSMRWSHPRKEKALRTRIVQIGLYAAMLPGLKSFLKVIRKLTFPSKNWLASRYGRIPPAKRMLIYFSHNLMAIFGLSLFLVISLIRNFTENE